MLKNFLENCSIQELYRLSRWCYWADSPIITDTEYDTLVKELEKAGYTDLLQMTYEDELYPEDIIRNYNLFDSVPKFIGSVSDRLEIYRSELMKCKSSSIEPFTTEDSCYEQFEAMIGYDLIISPKIDGVNMRSLVNPSTMCPVVASSRGRNGRQLKDYSDAALKKIPPLNGIDSSLVTGDYLVLYGEAFAEERHLTSLATRLPNCNYVNPRSAGSSIMQVGVPEDLEHCYRVVIHGVDNFLDTLSGSLDMLKKCGLDTVPYIKGRYTHKSREEFCVWLDNLCTGMKNLAKQNNLPIDGIVVQFDRFADFKGDFTERYNSGQFAVKVKDWAPQSYEGVVTGFLISSEQSSEYKSVRLQIEPVIASENSSVYTTIGGYNLDLIMKNNIHVGSKIKFKLISSCNASIELR